MNGTSCMASGNAEALHYTGNIFDYGCTTAAGGAWTPGTKCGIWTYEAGMGCGVSGNRAPNDKRTDRLGDGNTSSSTIRAALASSSAHTGGAFVLFADGSVHFVGDNIDLQTWANTCSYGYGEVAAYKDN